MANVKEIQITAACTNCGLCEQEEFKDIFAYHSSGKMEVLHNGLVDLELYPKVSELAELCPVQAIKIVDSKIETLDKNEALKEFNRLVNHELRDFPFKAPFYSEYAYESGVYTALQIPAHYRSEAKYLTDETAKDAGLREFKNAVFAQKNNIVKQYLTAYKVKVLQNYIRYEEIPENYYYSVNTKISKLLEKAYQLAKIIVGEQLDLPETFYHFEIKPELKPEFTIQKLRELEKLDMELEKSSSYHADADDYRTWVETGGDFKSCWYDFTDAEKEFRDDIDCAIRDRMDYKIEEDIAYLTEEFLKSAKDEVIKRIDILQEKVKNLSKASSKATFQNELDIFYSKVRTFSALDVTARYPDIDTDYNNECRFRSESSCLEAANNRRDRAYNDGLHYIEDLPRAFNTAYLNAIQKLLTEWKRELLEIYDNNGRPYPNKTIQVEIGDSTIRIPLNDHSDVPLANDDAIKNYFEDHIRFNPRWESIDGIKYVSEYECKIETIYDCDYRETLFGNYREINKKYGYFLRLYTFVSSAWEIAKACGAKLSASDFIKNYIGGIKASFLSEVYDAVASENKAQSVSHRVKGKA